MPKQMPRQIVGTISAEVISLLGLDTAVGTPIFIGESNRQHMITKHPEDYEKYGSYIPEILSSPDYVAQNPKNSSIEYVKEFHIDHDFVKVAVRITSSGAYYARTLYVLNSGRVERFIEQETLKKIKKD